MPVTDRRERTKALLESVTLSSECCKSVATAAEKSLEMHSHCLEAAWVPSEEKDRLRKQFNRVNRLHLGDWIAIIGGILRDQRELLGIAVTGAMHDETEMTVALRGSILTHETVLASLEQSLADLDSISV